MTSSYNISRRPLEDRIRPTNWGAYQRQFGQCGNGFVTVPILPGGNCSDWKFCVPIEKEDGLPASYPVQECKNLVNKHRRFTYDLYDNKDAPKRSLQNLYPPESRRAERRMLDKEDYFRLPMGFDGTGYYPARSWTFPQTATDHVELPDEWSPFHLIQRKQAQLDARKCRENVNSCRGTFYN